MGRKICSEVIFSIPSVREVVIKSSAADCEILVSIEPKAGKAAHLPKLQSTLFGLKCKLVQ